MSEYALVENGKVTLTGKVPSSFKNVSGFNTIKNPEKYKQYGFLPYSYVEPEYDVWTESLGGYTYEITDEEVIATREVFPIQVKQMEEQVSGQIRNITNIFNEIMYNTDWIFAGDSNLSAEQLTAYVALRASVATARQFIVAGFGYKGLTELFNALSLGMQEISLRLADFSSSMLELKVIVDAIGA